MYIQLGGNGLSFKNKEKEMLYQSLFNFIGWYIQYERYKASVKTKEYYLGLTPKTVCKFVEASNHYLCLSLQDKYQNVFYRFEFEFKKLSIGDAVVITYTDNEGKSFEGKFSVDNTEDFSRYLVEAVRHIPSEAYVKNFLLVLHGYIRSWMD